MGMGVDIPGDHGLSANIDLAMARQNIDLLELMYEKTRGNRTQEEDRLIEKLLYEIRMRYVAVMKEQGHEG